jgi:ABC transporter with metal-binding/Fe-S-binding domain ATP-binding protein
MLAACLFSGGKDSVYAVGEALKQGYEVIIITMNPEPYSMMFHHPNVKWTRLQAEAIGTKQIVVDTKHEQELTDLENALANLSPKPDAIFTGAVASEYQKKRIEAIGERLGVKVISPLWHADEKKLHELLDTMEIWVTAVSAEGLDERFLGQPLRKLVNAKVKNVHPFLEGGEGETFVTDAPFFKKKIIIFGWKTNWDGVRGVAEIKDAKLGSK